MPSRFGPFEWHLSDSSKTDGSALSAFMLALFLGPPAPREQSKFSSFIVG
jgi:hypothetical protein